MATYKKKGGTSKKKKIEEKSTTAEVFGTLDKTADRTEAWVAKNQRYILGVVGLIAVVVLGYFGYQKFIQAPKEANAADALAQPQTYFQDALAASTEVKDSLFTLSLLGGQAPGFVEISENYSGTDAGNLAHYYAGMAFLKTGEYQKAINHLDQFEGEETLLGPLAVGAIGDAFMQLNQTEQALNYYKKAASMLENSFTSPKFLLKSAIAAIELGNVEVAKEQLTQLEEKYPDSQEAKKVPFYMGLAMAGK